MKRFQSELIKDLLIYWAGAGETWITKIRYKNLKLNMNQKIVL